MSGASEAEKLRSFERSFQASTNFSFKRFPSKTMLFLQISTKKVRQAIIHLILYHRGYVKEKKRIRSIKIKLCRLVNGHVLPEDDKVDSDI